MTADLSEHQDGLPADEALALRRLSGFFSAAFLLLLPSGCSRVPTPAAPDPAGWPRFRGPQGTGVTDCPDMPATWSAKTGQGILWRSRVPLPGHGSPIVWGKRVFLTGATRDRREVYCFDAEAGRLLWRLPVSQVPGSPREASELGDMTGYAAPTPATDGERVCALFGNMDLVCSDMDGHLLWARNLGLPDNPYGHASSPVLHGGLVLVLKDQGLPGETESRLIALDVRSGEVVWERPRPVAASWSTPILINPGTGEQLITCADPWVIAYEPLTGSELWRARVLRDDVTPSPGYADGVVYVANIRSCAAAISVTGSGDVTRTHVRWIVEDDLPSICSVLAGRGLVLLLTTEGVLTCREATTGKGLWRHDFGVRCYASPTLVGDRAYVLDELGTMHVLSAGRAFRELSKASIGEETMATPAFLPGRLYIRGAAGLWCIGGP